MSAASVADPVLEVTGVSKAFGAVKALDDVTLSVRAGEVHGLIGQNGAGKSTLMAIAAGSLVPDSGTVRIAGGSALGDPELARQLGLAIVRQEPALMPDLTVAENLLLGVPASLRPPMGELNAWVSGLLQQWRPDISIRAGDRVNALSPEQRFIVDIVKALAAKPKVLVLDEPTEHLQGDDVQRLFDYIRSVTSSGTGVVYISHRIREVRMISNRVTVLRDGKGQGTYSVDGLEESEIIALIVGAVISREFPAKLPPDASREPVFTVRNYGGKGFHQVSMALSRGEIVGLAGIDGNGQREFMRALAGLNIARQGEITIEHRKTWIRNPDDAARHGIEYVSGDRHRESVFEDLSIKNNFSFRSIAKDSRLGFIDSGSETRRSVGALEQLSVKYGKLDDAIRTLSGGNQQKVVLAGALASQPAILLIDEPTQGVDIGSRMDIYRTIRNATDTGRSALVVSSDASELAGLCDRVFVFSRGAIAAELQGADVSESKIIAAILTATNARGDLHSHKDGPSPFQKLWPLLATDWAPLVMVTLATLMLGLWASVTTDTYLSVQNFGGMLALVATLGIVACAQQALMLVGGIDLSVGPLMGLIVVVQSFLLSSAPTAGNLAIGIALLVAISLAVGFVNWMLVDPFGLHPMAATLSTFMALQAVSLMLRPTSAGLIDDSVMEALSTSWSFVPATLVIALLLAVALDFTLFRRQAGVAFRGMGSNVTAARMAGIPIRKTRLLAYLSCSLLAAVAAIPLIGQVGIGDPRAGIDYTLTSIAAVVIGGGSLFGARGSFVGALLGALLIGQVNVVTAFLGLSEEWRSYLLGIMILAAVALHSKSRQLVLAR